MIEIAIVRRFRALALTAAACAALFAAADPSLAGRTKQGVRGELVAQDAEEDAKGAFRILHRVADGGRVSDRIELTAKKLDTTRDGNDDLPAYNVWLRSADDAIEADFGEVILTRSGRAGFTWVSGRNDLPSGVTDLTDFDGGTIELRQGDTVVLSAAVPSFSDLDDDAGSGSAAVRTDTTRLKPGDDTSRARGSVFARYANLPRGVNEQIQVNVTQLQPDDGPYTLVAIDGSANETEICELTPRGRQGAAVVVIDTRNGDTIPGGGTVQDLSGLDLEVRDAGGNVVLTGTFPDTNAR